MNLLEFLSANNGSITEGAYICGVTEITLRRWSDGTSRIPFEAVVKLRERYGAEVEAALLEKKETNDDA
jgi:hypothetical protein